MTWLCILCIGCAYPRTFSGLCGQLEAVLEHAGARAGTASLLHWPGVHTSRGHALLALVLHKNAIILKFNTAVLPAFGVWYALSGKNKPGFQMELTDQVSLCSRPVGTVGLSGASSCLQFRVLFAARWRGRAGCRLQLWVKARLALWAQGCAVTLYHSDSGLDGSEHNQ